MKRYNRQNSHMQYLPTGIPGGPAVLPMPSQQYKAVPLVPQQYPTVPLTQQYQAVPGPAPQTTENIMYTPGYMRTQIGRRAKVEFLIGTNLFLDKTGTLEAVGANYIILKESGSDGLLLCDLYSIKFVTFY